MEHIITDEFLKGKTVTLLVTASDEKLSLALHVNVLLDFSLAFDANFIIPETFQYLMDTFFSIKKAISLKFYNHFLILLRKIKLNLMSVELIIMCVCQPCCLSCVYIRVANWRLLVRDVVSKIRKVNPDEKMVPFLWNQTFVVQIQKETTFVTIWSLGRCAFISCLLYTWFCNSNKTYII